MNEQKEIVEDLSTPNEEVLILGEKFYLPEQIQWVQWKNFKKKLSEQGITFDNFGNLFSTEGEGEITLNIADIVGSLVESPIIPELLSIILIPKGETLWKEGFVEKHKAKMEAIGDKDLARVLTSFLSGRTELISILINSFTTLFNEKTVSLIQSSKETLKNLNT